MEACCSKKEEGEACDCAKACEACGAAAAQEEGESCGCGKAKEAA